MRTLVVLLLLALVLAPGAAAEEVGTSTEADTSSDDVLGPDPPPGNPCRPTCSTGTG